VTSYILLGLFGASCILLIADGMKRRTGIYEFSFLAGCGLFGFLFTQAVGVVRSPGMAPEAGVWKALIMSSLCAAAVYLGWKSTTPKRKEPRIPSPFQLKWIYRLGVVAIIIGVIGAVGTARLHGGVLGINVALGRHIVVYRGMPVVYYFFSVYGYLGLVLVASVALRLRSWLLAAPAAIPVLYALSNIFVAGRRNEFVLLGVAAGTLVYFATGITPPRLCAAIVAPLAMAAMFFAPIYRQYTLNQRWEQVGQLSVSEAVGRALSGSEGEFWTEAYEMEIADTEHMFQFGIGFYNSFIQYFVPKLIVGEAFKQKLYLPVPAARYDNNHQSWSYPDGMVPTGPFSVFEQFWYFGAICFYWLAKWLKRHWVLALEGDFLSALIYCVTVTGAVAAVTNDIYAIYPPLFMFVIPLRLFAKMQLGMRRLAQTYPDASAFAPRRTQNTATTHGHRVEVR